MADRARRAPTRIVMGKKHHTGLSSKMTAPPVQHSSFASTQAGSGTPNDPIRQPLRETPNDSGCLHCPTRTCYCNLFTESFSQAVEQLPIKRITEVTGNNSLCAKSLNPCFVARLAYLLDVQPGDTFYDLGSGNGSVVFQMALLSGAKCIGVEISPHNAEVARRTWSILRPDLEKRVGRALPEVEIITGDLASVIRTPEFLKVSRPKILTSNLVMPRALTHFMSEAFRALPVGAKIACFDDLYPHARACSQSRDPEAFQLFDMKDYVWPPLSVEWCSAEGPFYVHTRV